MESFILAAGLGTRLRPLTDHRPKALVEIEGKPLLQIAIERMVQRGVSRIVVNIHHYGEQIIGFINSRKWECEIVISDERKLLLDTGGGLQQAATLFTGEEPIIVHNVDIVSRIDLEEMVQRHLQGDNLATLAVSQRETSRYLLWDAEGQLVGWNNRSSNEYRWVSNPVSEYIALAFSGISIINPKLLSLLPPASKPYPIIPEYLNMAQRYRIGQYQHCPSDWLDVGKPDTLSRATTLLKACRTDSM